MLSQLTKKARAEIKKGDAAKGNADQHYLRAGEYLLKAKAEAGHGKWLPALKRIGISQRRAHELMQIAGGEVTVSEMREEKRKREAKSEAKRRKKKSKSASADANSNGSACDYNPEDPAHVAEPGDTDQEIRHRIFMNHASEALRHAQSNGLEDVDDSEIDKEIVSAAQTAAEAWTDLYKQLARRIARKGNQPNDRKEKASPSSPRASLH